MQWQWYTFEDLSEIGLYKLLALRIEVFIVEQRCMYQECDLLDLNAHHLLGKVDHQVVACLRVIPYDDSRLLKIGRVAVAKAERGRGLGKEMLRRAIKLAASKYSDWGVQLSAQCHLQDYYRSLGFESQGEPYDEVGIQHILMQYQDEK